jgi:hypothetical protein
MNEDEALDFIAVMIVYIDEHIDDVRGAGPSYFEDIREKAISVGDSIEEYNNCTANQARALKNWQAGLEKWVHDD